jgi:NAD(P)-dependent dehydrogenase (short-subunit alcohol dehydrogenase family)
VASFDLRGKVSVITGAGSGLGRTFAKTMAHYGAIAVCADRDLVRAEETAELIAGSGGRAAVIEADVSVAADVEAMARRIMGDHGRLDVLFNNAGVITLPKRTHEVSVEEWNQVIAINLTGVFLCTRAAIPLMLAGSGGSIVNISSAVGLVGLYPGFPAAAVNYAAAKAGIIGLTRQVAAEYAKDGIRANVIAPGFHAGTRLGDVRRATATPEDIKAFEKLVQSITPMARMGRLEELEGLAIYLASDASSFVTGQVFAHDGGLTAV